MLPIVDLLLVVLSLPVLVGASYLFAATLL